MCKCFHFLEESQLALEELKLKFTSIDDEGVNTLVNVLTKHLNPVWLLDLKGNNSITTNGWCAFATVLLPFSKNTETGG